MAQHDYNLANQSGADFRADLNNALSAIATVNSGASEPSTTFAHQLWVDTSNNVLKIRNAANSAFITTGISITADNVFTGALTGNASTATTLATARTINGTSFDGSANISFNTDSVAEGSSNLYFTNERVDDQVNALLQAGTGIQLTYDDTAGTLTIANTNDADITGVFSGNALTGGGTSGDVTLNVAVDDSSIEIDSDALRVKASGITNTMLAGSIANSKLANSGVTINSQSLSLGGTLVLDTDNIGEGSSNLYYTDARARAAISENSAQLSYNSTTGVLTYTQGDTDTVSEGSSNLYYTQARFDTAFGNKTTADLTENTNLYYTDTRANSAIDARVTNTFINNLSGVVADTSTALATARTIALSGDIVGSVSFDGTADVTIASTIQANSVALGTDTTGNYIQTITGTANKITVSGSGSESADVTLTLPDDVQIASDLTVAGNLVVNGSLTSLDTTNLDIEDNLFQLNAGLTGSPVNDSGMLINRGNQNNGIFMWDESVDKFTLGLTTADGTSTGNITLASLGTLVANVEGNVTGTIQTAAQPNITSLGTLSTLTVDDITIDGSTISDGGNFTIDSGADISLDSSNGIIRLKDDGTEFGKITQNSNNLRIFSSISDGDILLQGNDGGSSITALTLDMSNAGKALFNKDIGLVDNGTAFFGSSGDLKIYHDGSNSYIQNVTNSLIIQNDSDDRQIIIKSDNGSGGVADYFRAKGDTGEAIMYHYGSQKLATTSTGITVHSNGNETYSVTLVSSGAYTQSYNQTTSAFEDLYTSSLNKIFKTGSSPTEALRIDSSQNVGIGTSPTTPLHVYHATTDTVANFQSGDNSVAVNFTALDNSMQIATSNTDGILKNNGAGSLRFFNNGSERARLDSSGQLLIGKTASDNTTVGTRINGSGFISSVVDGDNAVLLNRLNSDGSIVLFRKDGTSVGAINTVSDDLAILSSISGHKGLRFGAGAITPTTNTAAIDNGNTDLGGNSIRFKDLYLAGTANVNKVSVDGSGANGIDLEADSSATTNSNRLFFSTSAGTNSIMGVSGALTFRTGATAGSASGTERFRLDSSGNFMVGKTSVAVSTTGSEIRSDGQVSIVREGDTPLFINRKTDDGTVIDLRKDNSTVGKIGTFASRLYIGNDDTFLTFEGAADKIYPADSSGASRDNAIDLGGSSARFKDIHLRGSVYADLVRGFEDTDTYVNFAGNNVLSFITGASERVRIDSQGNLLVGATSFNTGAFGATKGINIAHTQPIVLLHETDTDKDGYIGMAASEMFIGTADAIPIRFHTSDAEKMRLDASGNLGIGTDSPSSRLETVGGDGITISNSGDTFLQLKTTGTTATNYIEFKDSGGSAGNISYNHTDNYLATKVNGTERMRILSNGSFCIGGTAIQAVNSVSFAKETNGITFDNNTASSAGNGHEYQTFRRNSSQIGGITMNGTTGVSYNTSSDARLKDVIGEARGLEVINELNPVAYNWKADGRADEGLIAQEVLDIVPNAVSGSEEEMYQMDYSKLVVHLVAGMKEQQEQIEELKQQIKNLTGE